MGNGHEPDRHHRGRAGLCFRRRRTRELQKSSAFTPRVQPIASRRWSRSGRGCIGASAPSRPAWRVGSSCVTITAPITCPAISRARSKCLGIEASPSFVREPEGNGVAERFIRTLKENLLWVRTFKTIEELRAGNVRIRQALNNETWLVARHGYKTPAEGSGEKSKPCHQLRLTRRSLPPYPWPPEQAQPGVSKPCRTAKSRVHRRTKRPPSCW